MGCSCSNTLPGQGAAKPRDPYTLKKLTKSNDSNLNKPVNRDEWLVRRHAAKQNKAVETTTTNIQNNPSRKKSMSRLEYILSQRP